MVQEEKRVLITEIQRYSVNDGPGIRTNVFIKGCPLRCWWCHNPETIHPYPEIYWKKVLCQQCGKCYIACPRGAIYPPIPKEEAAEEGSTYYKIDLEKCDRCLKCPEACLYEGLTLVGKPMSVEEVLNEVERDVPFYTNSGGGMTVTGGEPTTQPQFLLELVKKGKERGLHICLDTCGYCPWDTLEVTMPYVDIYLYDIKHLDSEKHKEATGVQNELILDNLKKLLAGGATVWARLPTIPGFNDSPEYIESLAKFLKGLPAPVARIDFLPFHNYCLGKYEMLGRDWKYKDTEATDWGEVEPLKEILESYGLPIEVGGGGVVTAAMSAVES